MDVLVVNLGILPSRQKAQAQIMAGHILVNDRPVTKPGELVSHEAQVRLRSQVKLHVSRGAEKIEEALRKFNLNVSDKVAVDVGSSTGGFTQVLLSQGIRKVYCVDVGVNLLAWEVRNDPRVIVMEGVNARHLRKDAFEELPEIVVVDVSFISLKLILPALKDAVSPTADWVTLIKPQFEVGKENVGKGGIVRKEEYRQEAIDSLTRFAESIGLQRLGLIKSPIKGQKGNIEFLAHWKRE